MSKVLVVHDGKRERELLLVERLVVGRDPACDISVDDGLLSRRHAEFVAAASAVTVRDLGSRNGVFVNGTRRAEQALKPGDVVQIGPLRVRYLGDRVATPGAPSPADADATRTIPGPQPHADVAFPTPLPASLDAFRAPASAEPEVDDAEGETRVVTAEAFAEAEKVAAVTDGDATGFTPTPRPAPMPLDRYAGSNENLVPVADPHGGPGARRAPEDTGNRPGTLPGYQGQSPWLVTPSTPREPPAVLPRTSNPPALGSFVLIQLGALAIIVFVSTVAPLILARGTVLSAIDEGSVTALLVWPILPIVISLAATLVIATIVNRRVLDTLGAGRQNAEGR